MLCVLMKRPDDRAAVPSDDDLLTTAPAARVLDKSEGFVRQAADDGRLKAIRTSSGARLFRRGDLIRFTQQ
jgi:Helix-turn-helix domain